MAEYQARGEQLYNLRIKLDTAEGNAKKQMDLLITAVAHLIAKSNAFFAKDELDPERKADSDKLAEDVIKRLKAEQMARDHTTGDQ